MDRAGNADSVNNHLERLEECDKGQENEGERMGFTVSVDQQRLSTYCRYFAQWP